MKVIDMKEPAQCNIEVIEELQSKIQTLENENRLLKERLDEAGISYADLVLNNSNEHTDFYDPDQGARIKRFEVTDKIASDFFMMFCRGRKDVYDLRYTNPKTGKNGYTHSALTVGTEAVISRKKMVFDVKIVS